MSIQSPSRISKTYKYNANEGKEVDGRPQWFGAVVYLLLTGIDPTREGVNFWAQSRKVNRVKEPVGFPVFLRLNSFVPLAPIPFYVFLSSLTPPFSQPTRYLLALMSDQTTNYWAFYRPGAGYHWGGLG